MQTGAFSNEALTAWGTVITGGAAVVGLFLTIYLAHRERRNRERGPHVEAAVRALVELEAMERGLSHLWGDGRPIPGTSFYGITPRDAALAARQEVDRLLVPQIHDKVVQRRLSHLCELLHQIGYGSLASEAPAETPKRNRIQTDVDNYLGYVRRTVNAFIGDRSLPREKAPPVLRREDDSAWTPPDIA